MTLSKRQKLRLVLAALALALMAFWAFDPCTPMQKILGIGGNALVLTSVLLSFFDVRKHPDHDDRTLFR